MNLCSFTGFLTEDPKLTQIDGVSHAEFTLVTYTYRTAKSTGVKNRIATFVKCEAWHTGADTIGQLFFKGSKIHIHDDQIMCSACPSPPDVYISACFGKP